MATSAALVERAVPPPLGAASAPEVPAPTPAKNTLPIERFIASAICWVRIEPEAPTSMPATISAVFCSAMPAAAADRPGNAFSVEMTTGMSAPPIGTTASTPSAPANSSISQNSSSQSAPAAITTARITVIASSPAVTALGVRMPRFITSWSFRKAMIEPQKEIEPMIAANRIGIRLRSSSSPGWRNSTTLISATAPPPTPLNSATICGIAVIFTLRAAGTPTAVPMTTPSTISPQSPTPRCSSVAATAMAMPTAAIWLPRTAVRGPRSIRSPTMNIEKATMYSRSMKSLRLIAAFRLLALEHPEHPVGDQEAADHVDRAEGDGDHQQHVVDHAVRRPDEQQAAEHDDAVDGVRAAHQRRVQRVRHLRDHLEADERGKHQDRQLGQQVHALDHLSFAHHAGALDDLVLEVEPEFDQRQDVARVERGRVLGHLRRQVQPADELHATGGRVRLPPPRPLAVAAPLRGEGDDHAGRRHPLDPPP